MPWGWRWRSLGGAERNRRYQQEHKEELAQLAESFAPAPRTGPSAASPALQQAEEQRRLGIGGRRAREFFDRFGQMPAAEQAQVTALAQPPERRPGFFGLQQPQNLSQGFFERAGRTVGRAIDKPGGNLAESALGALGLGLDVPLEAEQRFIAQQTQPRIRGGLQALNVPYADTAATVASQVALPSSLVPFSRAGKAGRLANMGWRGAQGALLGAGQESAYQQVQHGRPALPSELGFGAVAGGIGAGVLPELVTEGAKAALRRVPGRMQSVFALGPEDIPTGPRAAVPEGRGISAAAEVPPRTPLPSEQPPGAPPLEPPRGTASAGGFEPEQFRPGQGGRFPGMEPLPEPEPTLGAFEQPEAARRPAERDAVGEALDQVTLPPRVGRADAPTEAQRLGVEGRSRRIPPEVRAQLTEAPSVRYEPQTYEQVEQAFGDRYQSNLWTRFEDVTGRRTPAQAAIHAEYVKSNIYKAVEGQRGQFHIDDWAYRSKDALGLRLRGRQQGYALAVQPKPDAKIPKGALQDLGDILEHPDDYLPTPEQARAIQELRDIQLAGLRNEQVHNVDVDALAQGYISHLFKRTPNRNDSVAAVYQRLGGKAWFTKGREFVDLRQARAAGFQPVDALSALRSRARAGAEAIGNQRLVDRSRAMGKLPSQTVPETAKVRLKAAQGAYTEARKTALKTGALEDRLRAELAANELDLAKQLMRHEARLASERSPRVLGRVVKQDVADELSRYMERLDESGWDTAFRIARNTRVGADFGSAGIQNWYTLFRNPMAWLKGAAYGIEGMARDPTHYVVANADVIDEALKFNAVRPPAEFLLQEGAPLAQRVGNLPVLKQFQDFLEWNIFIPQVERWKGVRNALLNPDGSINAQRAIDMASVLRKQSGGALMPGLTPRQVKFWSKFWFAKEFLVATHGALTDPISKSGPARLEAARGLASAFGGAAAFTVGASLALNGKLPNMDDPDKPGFWGVRVGEGYVYPFGPYQPLIVALGRTKQGDRTAFPKYIEGKTSIPVHLFIRASEALGVTPLEAIRGESFGQPQIIKPQQGGLAGVGQAFIEELAPIGTGAILEGVERQGRAGLIASAELGGARTSVDTQGQEFRRRFEESYGRPYDASAGDRAIAETDPKLAPYLRRSDEASADTGFEPAMNRQERQEQLRAKEAELSLPDISRAVLAGNIEAGPAWKEAWEEYVTFKANIEARDFFGADFATSTDPRAQAYQAWSDVSPQAYRDQTTFEIDWDAYFRDKDAAFAQLDPALQGAIKARLKAVSPEVQRVERQYQAARDLRDQLGDMSPVRGLSAEQYGEVQDFVAEAVRFQDQYRRERGQDPPIDRVIAHLGQQQGRDPGLVRAAQVLNSGVPDRLRNVEYDRFLLANEAALLPFYPELYRRKALQLGSQAGVPVYAQAAAGTSSRRGRRGRRGRRQPAFLQ